MKRKITRRPGSQKKQKTRSSVNVIHIVAISFVILIVFLIGTLTVKAISSPTVLGSSTGPVLLTDQGSDSQEGPEDQNNQQIPQTGTDHPPFVPAHGHMEIQNEGNREINVETSQNHFHMKTEDTGLIKTTAHTGLGDEMRFSSNAAERINEFLKNKDIKVSSTSGNGFSIESGRIHAQTHFPLSIDPTTHTLTVTTPSGTKEVTVLPDQAVQSLLQHQILSSVNQSSESGTTSNTISLTQVNNQPAFAVSGQSDKKLFGLFPVTFNKTVFVSAQTGQVVQTQENIFNKLLETFSF